MNSRQLNSAEVLQCHSRAHQSIVHSKAFQRRRQLCNNTSKLILFISSPEQYIDPAVVSTQK